MKAWVPPSGVHRVCGEHWAGSIRYLLFPLLPSLGLFLICMTGRTV